MSHEIFDGLVTYKGLPAPHICDFWTREKSKDFYANDESFQIGRIDMVANTGTYLDTPFHRYDNGKDLSEIVLEQLVNLSAQIIEVPFENGLEINAALLKTHTIDKQAVLFCTGWSQFFNTEIYFNNHPFITKDAAQFLLDKGVILAGIDSHNIDDTRTKSRPVHTLLLANNCLIVEHLTNLKSIKNPNSFTFTATPPKIKGMGTFPVRAFASES